MRHCGSAPKIRTELVRREHAAPTRSRRPIWSTRTGTPSIDWRTRSRGRTGAHPGRAGCRARSPRAPRGRWATSRAATSRRPGTPARCRSRTRSGCPAAASPGTARPPCARHRPPPGQDRDDVGRHHRPSRGRAAARPSPAAPPRASPGRCRCRGPGAVILAGLAPALGASRSRCRSCPQGGERGLHAAVTAALIAAYAGGGGAHGGRRVGGRGPGAGPERSPLRRPGEQPHALADLGRASAARSAASSSRSPASSRRENDSGSTATPDRPRPHRELRRAEADVLDPDDEVRPGRRRAGRDDRPELRRERGEQRLLALGVVRPEPREVPLEVALGEEQGERPLLERARAPVRAPRGARRTPRRPPRARPRSRAAAPGTAPSRTSRRRAPGPPRPAPGATAADAPRSAARSRSRPR